MNGGSTAWPLGVADLLLDRVDDPGLGLLFADQRWTWSEVVAESAVRASWLKTNRGEGPFHIGVCLENTPEYLFWVGGAALVGATVVGVNPTRSGVEMTRDVRHTDCQFLVVDEPGVERFSGHDLGIDGSRILVVGTEDHRAALAEHHGAKLPTQVPDPSSLLLLLFTSGSTGSPKAVCCSSGRLADRGVIAAERYGFVPDDVCYCAMPLFHGNAMMGIWAPALRVGAAIALAPRFSASAFLLDVQRFGATFFNYVGRSISYLLATPPSEGDRDNSLRAGYGTEASWKDAEQFENRFGCPLIGGYGMSEGGGVNVVRSGDTPKTALGRPITDTIVVVDPETRSVCPPVAFDDVGRLTNSGEAIGEIVNTAGVDQFEGYYADPVATAERTRHGWFWTGDLGYVDREGYLYFAGRAGDRLRVDSENFSAVPIETILYRFAPIVSAAVYAVPDPDGGDAVMAAIELVDDAAFDAEAFEAFLDGQDDLGTKWPPQYVRILDRMPQTATGKVRKTDLRTERWNTDDAIWWRPDRREGRYERFTGEDRAALLARFDERGRASELI